MTGDYPKIISSPDVTVLYQDQYHVMEKKMAVVLKLFNRSHKSKKTKGHSAASPPHRGLLTQRVPGFSDSRFLRCHLVEIEDVITPRKIILVRTATQMQATISLCRGHLFVVSRKNAS